MEKEKEEKDQHTEEDLDMLYGDAMDSGRNSTSQIGDQEMQSEEREGEEEEDGDKSFDMYGDLDTGSGLLDGSLSPQTFQNTTTENAVNDLDLYDDILTEEDAQQKQSYEEKCKQYEFARKLIEKLEVENRKLKEDLSKQTVVSKNVQKNMSSLLVTARGELTRKDKEINDLRKKHQFPNRESYRNTGRQTMVDRQLQNRESDDSSSAGTKKERSSSDKRNKFVHSDIVERSRERHKTKGSYSRSGGDDRESRKEIDVFGRSRLIDTGSKSEEDSSDREGYSDSNTKRKNDNVQDNRSTVVSEKRGSKHDQSNSESVKKTHEYNNENRHGKRRENKRSKHESKEMDMKHNEKTQNESKEERPVYEKRRDKKRNIDDKEERSDHENRDRYKDRNRNQRHERMHELSHIKGKDTLPESQTSLQKDNDRNRSETKKDRKNSEKVRDESEDKEDNEKRETEVNGRIATESKQRKRETNARLKHGNVEEKHEVLKYPCISKSVSKVSDLREKLKQKRALSEKRVSPGTDFERIEIHSISMEKEDMSKSTKDVHGQCEQSDAPKLINEQNIIVIPNQEVDKSISNTEIVNDVEILDTCKTNVKEKNFRKVRQDSKISRNPSDPTPRNSSVPSTNSETSNLEFSHKRDIVDYEDFSYESILSLEGPVLRNEIIGKDSRKTLERKDEISYEKKTDNSRLTALENCDHVEKSVDNMPNGNVKPPIEANEKRTFSDHNDSQMDKSETHEKTVEKSLDDRIDNENALNNKSFDMEDEQSNKKIKSSATENNSTETPVQKINTHKTERRKSSEKKRKNSYRGVTSETISSVTCIDESPSVEEFVRNLRKESENSGNENNETGLSDIQNCSDKSDMHESRQFDCVAVNISLETKSKVAENNEIEHDPDISAKTGSKVTEHAEVEGKKLRKRFCSKEGCLIKVNHLHPKSELNLTRLPGSQLQDAHDNCIQTSAKEETERVLEKGKSCHQDQQPVCNPISSSSSNKEADSESFNPESDTIAKEHSTMEEKTDLVMQSKHIEGLGVESTDNCESKPDQSEKLMIKSETTAFTPHTVSDHTGLTRSNNKEVTNISSKKTEATTTRKPITVTDNSTELDNKIESVTVDVEKLETTTNVNTTNVFNKLPDDDSSYTSGGSGSSSDSSDGGSSSGSKCGSGCSCSSSGDSSGDESSSESDSGELPEANKISSTKDIAPESVPTKVFIEEKQDADNILCSKPNLHIVETRKATIQPDKMPQNSELEYIKEKDVALEETCDEVTHKHKKQFTGLKQKDEKDTEGLPERSITANPLKETVIVEHNAFEKESTVMLTSDASDIAVASKSNLQLKKASSHQSLQARSSLLNSLLRGITSVLNQKEEEEKYLKNSIDTKCDKVTDHGKILSDCEPCKADQFNMSTKEGDGVKQASTLYKADCAAKDSILKANKVIDDQDMSMLKHTSTTDLHSHTNGVTPNDNNIRETRSHEKQSSDLIDAKTMKDNDSNVKDFDHTNVHIDIPNMSNNSDKSVSDQVTRHTTNDESETVDVPDDNAVSVPEDSTVSVPEGNAVSVPEGNAVSVPEENAVSVPKDNAVSVPEENAVSVPEGNAVSVPEENAVSVPEGNAVSVPEENAVSVPEGNAVSVPKDNAVSVPEDNALETSIFGSTLSVSSDDSSSDSGSQSDSGSSSSSYSGSGSSSYSSDSDSNTDYSETKTQSKDVSKSKPGHTHKPQGNNSKQITPITTQDVDETAGNKTYKQTNNQPKVQVLNPTAAVNKTSKSIPHIKSSTDLPCVNVSKQSTPVSTKDALDGMSSKNVPHNKSISGKAGVDCKNSTEKISKATTDKSVDQHCTGRTKDLPANTKSSSSNELDGIQYLIQDEMPKFMSDTLELKRITHKKVGKSQKKALPKPYAPLITISNETVMVSDAFENNTNENKDEVVISGTSNKANKRGLSNKGQTFRGEDNLKGAKKSSNEGKGHLSKNTTKAKRKSKSTEDLSKGCVEKEREDGITKNIVCNKKDEDELAVNISDQSCIKTSSYEEKRVKGNKDTMLGSTSHDSLNQTGVKGDSRESTLKSSSKKSYIFTMSPSERGKSKNKVNKTILSTDKPVVTTKTQPKCPVKTSRSDKSVTGSILRLVSKSNENVKEKSERKPIDKSRLKSPKKKPTKTPSTERNLTKQSANTSKYSGTNGTRLTFEHEALPELRDPANELTEYIAKIAVYNTRVQEDRKSSRNMKNAKQKKSSPPSKLVRKKAKPVISSDTEDYDVEEEKSEFQNKKKAAHGNASIQEKKRSHSEIHLDKSNPDKKKAAQCKDSLKVSSHSESLGHQRNKDKLQGNHGFKSKDSQSFEHILEDYESQFLCTSTKSKLEHKTKSRGNSLDRTGSGNSLKSSNSAKKGTCEVSKEGQPSTIKSTKTTKLPEISTLPANNNRKENSLPDKKVGDTDKLTSKAEAAMKSVYCKESVSDELNINSDSDTSELDSEDEDKMIRAIFGSSESSGSSRPKSSESIKHRSAKGNTRTKSAERHSRVIKNLDEKLIELYSAGRQVPESKSIKSSSNITDTSESTVVSDTKHTDSNVKNTHEPSVLMSKEKQTDHKVKAKPRSTEKDPIRKKSDTNVTTDIEKQIDITSEKTHTDLNPTATSSLNRTSPLQKQTHSNKTDKSEPSLPKPLPTANKLKDGTLSSHAYSKNKKSSNVQDGEPNEPSVLMSKEKQTDYKVKDKPRSTEKDPIRKKNDTIVTTDIEKQIDITSEKTHTDLKDRTLSSHAYSKNKKSSNVPDCEPIVISHVHNKTDSTEVKRHKSVLKSLSPKENKRKGETIQLEGTSESIHQKKIGGNKDKSVTDYILDDGDVFDGIDYEDDLIFVLDESGLVHSDQDDNAAEGTVRKDGANTISAGHDNESSEEGELSSDSEGTGDDVDENVKCSDPFENTATTPRKSHSRHKQLDSKHKPFSPIKFPSPADSPSKQDGIDYGSPCTYVDSSSLAKRGSELKRKRRRSESDSCNEENGPAYSSAKNKLSERVRKQRNTPDSSKKNASDSPVVRRRRSRSRSPKVNRQRKSRSPKGHISRRSCSISPRRHRKSFQSSFVSRSNSQSKRRRRSRSGSNEKSKETYRRHKERSDNERHVRRNRSKNESSSEDEISDNRYRGSVKSAAKIRHYHRKRRRSDSLSRCYDSPKAASNRRRDYSTRRRNDSDSDEVHSYINTKHSSKKFTHGSSSSKKDISRKELKLETSSRPHKDLPLYKDLHSRKRHSSHKRKYVSSSDDEYVLVKKTELKKRMIVRSVTPTFSDSGECTVDSDLPTPAAHRKNSSEKENYLSPLCKR